MEFPANLLTAGVAFDLVNILTFTSISTLSQRSKSMAANAKFVAESGIMKNCPGEDSNFHTLRHQNLNLESLPVVYLLSLF